jgi:cupin fold WbuC family metalloprotein
MRLITQELLDGLIERAWRSERRRVNFNLHEYHEPVQRMVNALVPGTYVTPHKHQNPDKVELIAVLTGKVACFKFSNTGDIQEAHILEAQGSVRAVDIRPGVYHTFIALAPSALLEIIQGPYHPDTHKQFAAWAPREGAPEAADYLNWLEGIADALHQQGA